MKYAHLERERRFVVLDLARLPPSGLPVHITDRYITGTRLRLRLVREPGGDTVWKLGQKVRFASGDALALAHTSLFLNEAEYKVLAALPSTTLSKTRTLVPLGDEHQAAIDTFEGPLAGLTLVEIDAGATGSFPPLPKWVGREVSSLEAFTGQALSLLTAPQLAALIQTQATDRGI